MSSANEPFQCDRCEETFDDRDAFEDHLHEDHDIDAEEAAAAASDASGSTGSMTDESNAPSAAEPAEAAGPSNEDDDVRPDDADD
jgi:hypothetical protein